MHEGPGRGRGNGWERHEARPGRGGAPPPEPLAHLYALAAGLLRARHVRGIEADDLVQEACLALERGPRPADPIRQDVHALRGWEAAVVTNRLKELLRNRSVRARANGAGRRGPFGPAEAASGGGFERVDEALDLPLAALPEGLRPAAVLVSAGLSAGEAACALRLAEAELRRRALLAAWILAAGGPPPARGPGGLPKGARARNGLLDAVSRRRREGWSWVALGCLLQLDWRSLRRAVHRRDTRNPP